MARRKLRALGSSGLGIIALLSGCSGSSGKGPGDGKPDIDFTNAALLTQASSCDDLLARIQADAIAHLDVAAEQALQQMDGNTRGGPVLGGGFGIAESGGALGADNLASGSAPPKASPSSNGTTGGAAQGPSGYSETNVQVAGVDEADIVKTDGEHIYLLHGSEIFVLKSFPAAETAITGHAMVEGQPQELFVADGKAVVFTTLWDAAGLYDVGETDAATDYYYGGTPFTKITVLDVTTDDPTVLRELFVEGSYLSARRHDAIVRVVMQDGFKVPSFYPNIEYSDPWGVPYEKSELVAQLDAWKERMKKAIESSTLDRWLPAEREKVDGEVQALPPRCGDYYVPFPGMTQPGVTTVVNLDLDDVSGSLSGATILGSSREVYANQDTLVLAQDDLRWAYAAGDRQQTALHRFDISGGATQYEASGQVPGEVHDQFSIDEQDGVIRVATTERLFEERTEDWGTWVEQTGIQNLVTTVGVSEGALVELGSTAPFGDGEQIYSARFVGDRGYVVTYMQTDPLFVVDVSDPKSPKVLGHLDIPGFSNYMHPLEGDHLLTIGRQTEALSGGGTRDVGLQLQIFDVSDPLAPERTQQYVYTQPGYSEATAEHKAFTYYADKKLLAFPFVSYGNPSYQSTLEVFRVSPETGFEKLGSADHTQLLANQCVDQGLVPNCGPDYCEPIWCGPEPEVRRGLFIDDYVYSISYGGVLVNSLDDFDTAVATVQLPAPEYDYGDYGGGVSGGSGVAVGGVAPGVAVPPAQTEPAPPPDSAGAAVDGGAAEPVGVDGGAASR